MRTAVVGFLVLVRCACGQDMPLEDVLVEGEGWEVISEGHGFTDGVAADAEGRLYFSDVGKGDGVWRVGADGKVEKYLEQSVKISGLEWGADGRLYACLPRDGKVVVFGEGGAVTVLAEGVKPNDLAVRANGGVYFTQTGAKKVTYIAPGGGVKDVDAGSVTKPNGIALSADGGTLAVSDHGGKNVWAWRVSDNGDLDAGSPYMEMRHIAGVAKGDGMCVDFAGRFFVTTALGVQMFDPTGRISGVIPAPDGAKPIVSVGFGGARGEWMYVCNGSGVFRRRVVGSEK